MSFVTVKSTTEADCGCVVVQCANDQFARVAGYGAVGGKAGDGGVGDGEFGMGGGEGFA